MRSASVAEWILSLVTPPDRAASTTGDLVEEASTRGVLWFWLSVLRTTCRQLWGDLSASPRQIVHLAFWGWLGYFVITSLLVTLLISVPMICFGRSGHSFAVPLWDSIVTTVVVWTAVPFLVGWMIASRSKGRELAVVVAVVFLSPVFALLRAYLFERKEPGVMYGRAEYHPLTIILGICLPILFLLAGAIRFRRRSVKRITHA